jgi:hypothetical protein
MTVTSYIFLALYVIWSLGLLLFVLPAAADKGLGFGFLGVGLILTLLHRPLGWLMFKFDPFHIERLIDSWEGLGQRGARVWYLAVGLVSIGLGCVYLIRSVI